MILGKQVFTYKTYGFTKFVELIESKWKLTIISNQESEVVFKKDYVQLSDVVYVETDVKAALDEYVKTAMTEFDEVGAYLLGVNLHEPS